MKNQMSTPLGSLKKGAKAVVCAVSCMNSDIYRRLLSFGIVEGSEVVVRGAAPLGDPICIYTAGTEISLRKSDANSIQVMCLD